MALSSLAVIPGLDATSYQRHALHAEERVWVEKNCYIDVWIELVHALGCDPVAMLGVVAALDFEGDQWTFFKPSHGEIHELYGLDVQELNVWRTLLEHVVEHVPQGKLISTEADAFWLPDTSGTDYQRQHTKTTIVVNEIDVARERLGYFHNAGYYTLEGEDFRRTFRVGAPHDPSFMPLFAETVQTRRLVRRTPVELRELARRFLVTHLLRRPVDNPVERFAARLAADLPLITERGLAHYHAWAFATIRQLGAAFELLAQHLLWLDDDAFESATAEFSQIASGAKVLILKGARAVNSRRNVDLSSQFAELSNAWTNGMAALTSALSL
ncbi:MAG TPA: DUF1839 family protein [Polyangiaceae bacterium]|nr:DUF1839 family protein [Polyangiaceae bacterium]